MIDDEKKALDDKVDKSRFSFIVLKSHFYKALIEAMRNLNTQLEGDISKSKLSFADIIQFVPDEEAVHSLLYEIFNKCLKLNN